MSIPGAFATALAAVLLLSSCAPSPSPVTEHSESATPTPTASQPAFLATDQLDADRLPDGVAERMNVDPASSRYEGDWDQRHIYLARQSDDSVCLLSSPLDDPTAWRSGCGASNGVVTVQFSDGGTVKYLPITSSATPAGWTRLSDYVFVM